jgi:tetraacyldisaccharide 4'-kinase
VERRRSRCEAERHAGPLRWIEARHAPRDLIAPGGEPEPLGSLDGLRVAAFCGIGNPDGFRRTLESLGVSAIGFRAFPDHHAYTGADVSDLAGWGSGLGADLLLTTQKDSVKLRSPSLGPVPLRALRIGLEVLDGESLLGEALDRLTDKARANP